MPTTTTKNWGMPVKKIGLLLATLLCTSLADAQTPPTGLFGIDLTANNAQSTSANNHFRFRYNSTTGVLEQSVSTAAYTQITGLPFYALVTGETGVTNKTYPVGDVRRYGAVGDWNGATGTDNRSAITNAITSAAAIAAANTNSGNAVVSLPCGQFMVGQNGGSTTDFSLMGQSNITIQGQGTCTVLYGNIVNAGNYTHHTVIGASGFWTDYPGLGSTTNPWQNYPPARIGTNMIALGATTITANPAGGFSTTLPGDWIEVSEGPAPKWDTKVERAQVLTVVGDTITLTAPIDIGFDNSSGTGVGILRITPVQNFLVKDLAIAGTTQAYGPFFQTTVGGGVDNVTVQSANWINPFWYANNTHFFTLKDSEVLTGVFGGFNRASHGTVSKTHFYSVGALSIEFGQGGVFNHWYRNDFIGAVAPTGNGYTIAGGDTWYETWDENTIAGDNTLQGVFQVKGSVGLHFTHNIINVGAVISAIIQVESSDGTNTGVAATEIEITENNITVDAAAAAPSQATLYVGGFPQVQNSRFSGNRLNAPAAFVPMFKIQSPNTTQSLFLLGNLSQNGGTPFTLIADDSAGNFYSSTDATASTGGTLGKTDHRFQTVFVFNLKVGNAAATDTAGSTLTIAGQDAGPASAATGKVGGPITVTPGVGSAGSAGGGFAGGVGGALNLNGARGGAGGAGINPGNGGNVVVTTGQPGSQNGGAGAGNSGFFVVNIPAAVGAGGSGQFQVQFAGSNHLTFTSSDTMQFAAAAGNKTFSVATAAVDTAGTSFTTQAAQGGAASAVAGGTGGIRSDAAGQGGTSDGTRAAGVGGQGNGSNGGVGGTGSGAIAPGNGGVAVFAGGAAGTGGSGNANGGNSSLRGGALSGTGTPGNVLVGDLNTGSVFVAGAASAKLGFFSNSTAVVQQSTTGTTTITSAGTGTPILADTTSTGGVGATAYTHADVIRALKQYNLLLN